MANKSFGVKEINIVGEEGGVGTPTIQSTTNLNLSAVTVAISTDVTIGGQVTSNIIVGTGKSVGIGTINPTSKLHVVGDGKFTGIVTATTFISENSSGTPKIESPNNLNLNAATVAISTDLSVGGNFASDLKIGTSYKIIFNSSNVKIGDNSTGYYTSGVGNNFIGVGAGLFNTTGGFNNFIGVGAGSTNTTGSDNTYIGRFAGASLSSVVGTGACNIAIGALAARNITSGNSNVFLGSCSGYSNTSGSCNNFLGHNAGFSNIDGSQNNFIGLLAGLSNTNGCQNNFIGVEAGRYNTTGCANNFIGVGAGFCNTTGGCNNFFGSNAGFCNTCGCFNIFIGAGAGYSNSCGKANIIIGNLAGCAGIDTNFSANIFIGAETGKSATKGSNVFIGVGVGTVTTTGFGNLVLGHGAGANLTSGYGNIIIGDRQIFNLYNPPGICYLLGDPVYEVTTENNLIVIGTHQTSKFYTKMAGSGSNGNVVCYNGSTYELYSASSSCKFKDNIKPFLSGISEILNLEPVTFNYIDRPEDSEQIGFIAEQLDELDLTHFVNYDGNNEPNGISYDKLIVLAVNAIKELHEENQNLNQRLTEIETVLKNLS